MDRLILFLIICPFFIFAGCKEDSNISFSEINISSKNNNIVEVNIPRAAGDEVISNIINSKIANRINRSLQLNDSVRSLQSIEDGIAYFNNEYKAFKEDFPESSQIWEAQIDGELLHQSAELICISITTYINTGGAHGILNISFLNFDSFTGNLIPNINLFKDLNAFKKVAKPYFENAISYKTRSFDTEIFKLPENITYSGNGIVLLYNTYEIASYAEGIIEFTIPYNEAQPYLVFNSL